MERDKKALLLFGAGASFGASTCPEDRPPVGNDLLPMLKKDFPKTWGLISEDYFQDTNRFEEGLETFLKKNDELLFPLMKDMARYFSKFHIKTNNNKYYQLIESFRDELNNGNFFLYTINYEILLDLALYHNKVSFNYNPYEYSNKVNLIKLHGSCNFIVTLQANVKGKIIMSHSIDEYGNIQFGVINGNLEIIENNKINDYLKKKERFPMMALYTKIKNPLINKDQLLKMHERYAEDIRKSSIVIVIGVKPVDYDEHIWEPLKGYRGEIVFVGNRKLLKKWCYENNIKGKIIHYRCNYWRRINIIIKKHFKS